MRERDQNLFIEQGNVELPLLRFNPRPIIFELSPGSIVPAIQVDLQSWDYAQFICSELRLNADWKIFCQAPASHLAFAWVHNYVHMQFEAQPFLGRSMLRFYVAQNCALTLVRLDPEKFASVICPIGMLLQFNPATWHATVLIRTWQSHEYTGGTRSVNKVSTWRLKILTHVPATWVFLIHPLSFDREEQEMHDILFYPATRRLAMLQDPSFAEAAKVMCQSFFKQPETFW